MSPHVIRIDEVRKLIYLLKFFFPEMSQHKPASKQKCSKSFVTLSLTHTYIHTRCKCNQNTWIRHNRKAMIFRKKKVEQ